jgi:hypothetical protein
MSLARSGKTASKSARLVVEAIIRQLGNEEVSKREEHRANKQSLMPSPAERDLFVLFVMFALFGARYNCRVGKM